MALERGLGRGLGALLGDAALQSQEGGSLSLPISQVEPSAGSRLATTRSSPASAAGGPPSWRA